ncbi:MULTISPECIES: hypothetical protein [Clostridium]|jgi:hypothetical protein|uniref:Uncharacterized protein n=1 Tax=Clostridium manihotivorum TaxID=2320868 RepID=A0A410DNH6_9CLOT|nr:MULTISPECIES: hypothetical protein [Clostridium]QAA30653.1 hypothetical protein C1I91_02655 [Clostridium manihotivorum]
MVWDKMRELNLDDKIEEHLKDVTQRDSNAVEEIVTDPELLMKVKEFIHAGMDPRTIGESLNLSVKQVNIIKDMLGKM